VAPVPAAMRAYGFAADGFGTVGKPSWLHSIQEPS
jgi:hypothetical protein